MVVLSLKFQKFIVLDDKYDLRVTSSVSYQPYERIIQKTNENRIMNALLNIWQSKCFHNDEFSFKCHIDCYDIVEFFLKKDSQFSISLSEIVRNCCRFHFPFFYVVK